MCRLKWIPEYLRNRAGNLRIAKRSLVGSAHLNVGLMCIECVPNVGLMWGLKELMWGLKELMWV